MLQLAHAYTLLHNLKGSLHLHDQRKVYLVSGHCRVQYYGSVIGER